MSVPSPDRVASRYLLARVALAKVLQDGILAYQAGKGGSGVDAALATLSAVLEVKEIPLDFGVGLKIQADWYHALGKIQSKRVWNIVREAKELSRWTGHDDPDVHILKRLKALVPEFQWLETKARETSDEIPHDPFILVQMPGVSRKAMGEAVAALDDATKFIQRKFSKVLYGKVFVALRVSGSSSKAVALYTVGGDKVYLSLQAKDTIGDVLAICHEFGHRYFHRFWKDSKAKAEFLRLSLETVYETITYPPARKKELAGEMLEQVRARRKGGTPPPPSDSLNAYLGRITKDRGFHIKLWELSQAAMRGGIKEEKALVETFIQIGPDEAQTDKVLRPALAVTPYGGTSWTENFAEAFAFYVMGKPLPPELKTIMDDLS